MINKHKRWMIMGGLMLLLAAPASADVLLIEEVRERMLRDLPANGMTMSEVERRFGEPSERRVAVGNPPITRWIYAEYTVFFEHDLVIDSVLNPGAVMTRLQQQTGR